MFMENPSFEHKPENMSEFFELGVGGRTKAYSKEEIEKMVENYYPAVAADPSNRTNLMGLNILVTTKITDEINEELKNPPKNRLALHKENGNWNTIAKIIRDKIKELNEKRG